MEHVLYMGCAPRICRTKLFLPQSRTFDLPVIHCPFLSSVQNLKSCEHQKSSIKEIMINNGLMVMIKHVINRG